MLKSYWQAEDVDDSDKFLRDFIVNKRWVDPNAKVLPSYDEVSHNTAIVSVYVVMYVYMCDVDCG